MTEPWITLPTTGKPCECWLCLRGRRYTELTAEFLDTDREFMEQIYDLLMNLESDQEMRDHAKKIGRYQRKKKR